MTRSRWAVAAGAGVAVVLVALAAYQLLLLEPHGPSRSEAIEMYLFVTIIATTAGGTSAAIQGIGWAAGAAAGVGLAVFLALITGNGPDEGDGFFWLVVGALIISTVAAVVAAISARRLRRDLG